MAEESSHPPRPPAAAAANGGPNASDLPPAGPEARRVVAPYRETTPAALLLGIPIGIIMTAAITYAGLAIGVVVPASAIAAVLGWAALRGMLRRGTIVENNINQTVASAINNTAGGVIFTFPALLLMDEVEYNLTAIILAATAGGLLGTLLIVPLRRQMIDLERLRFPGGIAVAEILRTPGAGLRSGVLLLAATVVAMLVSFLARAEVIPSRIDLGTPMGLPAYVPNEWAVSLMALGIGYLAGRPGLVVLLGGILANWIIAPTVVGIEWVQPPDSADAAEQAAALKDILREQVHQPLGIGLLAGGALAGVAVAVPMIRAAFSGMRGGLGPRQELSPKWMVLATGGSLVLLLAATLLADPGVSIERALLTAVVGTAWMWLAGIIVAQCAGLTGWSPISGLALLAVAIVLLLSGGSIGLAVLIGAAVCVAIGQGADMMTDLKAGHLVGARPVRQQVMQLAVSWMGPVISIATVLVLWHTVKFGPANEEIPAPQAVALKEMIATVLGGEVPLDKYLIGGGVGALVTLALGGGFGVLVGLSMYLPMFFVLPFGLGCVLAMGVNRVWGQRRSQMWIIPIAAGFLVGDALEGVIAAIYAMLTM